MTLLPEFQIGLFNGWIPLAAYFIGFMISISLFSQERKKWLFNNPRITSRGAFGILRLFGQLMMVAFIGMMIFTPLSASHPIKYIGAGIYAAGYGLVISALHSFRKTAAGQPVAGGPYRISRNPQWVGLFLVLMGSAVSTGIWLYIGILVVVAFIYHRQILDEETVCMEKYGESYRNYMRSIPRYLLFV